MYKTYSYINIYIFRSKFHTTNQMSPFGYTETEWPQGSFVLTEKNSPSVNLHVAANTCSSPCSIQCVWSYAQWKQNKFWLGRHLFHWYCWSNSEFGQVLLVIWRRDWDLCDERAIATAFWPKKPDCPSCCTYIFFAYSLYIFIFIYLFLKGCIQWTKNLWQVHARHHS